MNVLSINVIAFMQNINVLSGIWTHQEKIFCYWKVNVPVSTVDNYMVHIHV